MNRENAAPGKLIDELALAKQGLLARIAKKAQTIGPSATAVPSLTLVRRESPSEPRTYIHEPSVCMVAQGAKRVLLGKESYVYDADHYLITSLDVPVVAEITEASREKPYFGLTLKLDQKTISQLLVDSSIPAPRAAPISRVMIVSEVSLPLLNAFLRLIDLLDEPNSIAVLSPLIEREIAYRLLVSEQGPLLRQIGSAGSQSYQIARAIDWLKKNYSLPIMVEELAELSHMSASSFHHHFRELTAMSPLQYQKYLRLQEARRLMLAERLDAASAAFRVGYESPSQFSREYKRMFEASPSRDIKSLRNVEVSERTNP
jgi:AraC-like DNA-binding protein